MFSPPCSAAAQIPFRWATWRLKSDAFDYRAAKNSGAIENTGRPWYSRREERVFGDSELRCPQTNDLESPLSVEIRLSWFPSHFSAVWEEWGGPISNIYAAAWWDHRLVGSVPSMTTGFSRMRFANRPQPKAFSPKFNSRPGNPATENRTSRKSDTPSEHSDAKSKAPSLDRTEPHRRHWTRSCQSVRRPNPPHLRKMNHPPIPPSRRIPRGPFPRSFRRRPVARK